MNPRGTTPRRLQYVARFEDLKLGDILLFRVSKDVYLSQQFIMFFQSLLCLEHGHYDTTHVAICVDHDEKHQPIIAHVYEMDKKLQYQRHTLAKMLEPEGGDRAFLVFRPKNQYAAKEIAKVAGDEKEHHDVQWSLKIAIQTFIGGSARDLSALTEIKNVTKLTICSNFVIDSIHKAEQRRFERGETILDTLKLKHSTPKRLEQYFYNDVDNYDIACYPGKDTYKLLQKEMEDQLNRIKSRTDNASKQKYNLAIKQYQLVMKTLEDTPQPNELDKSLTMLKIMLPILKINTGWGVRTTSDKVVLNAARKIGIFQRDIDQFSLDLVKSIRPATPLRRFRS